MTLTSTAQRLGRSLARVASASAGRTIVLFTVCAAANVTLAVVPFEFKKDWKASMLQFSADAALASAREPKTVWGFMFN